jgi:hypothetical protein
VSTAQYAQSPYITLIRLVLKGLIFKSCACKCWLTNEEKNMIHSMYNIKTVELVTTTGL